MSATMTPNNWPANKRLQRIYEALQELSKGNTADQPFGIGWHTVNALAAKSGVSITTIYKCSAGLAKMPGVRIKTFIGKTSAGKVHTMRFDALQ